MAIFKELYVDQGATFSQNITLTLETTNTSINIAGYTFSSQMRRSYYSSNITANLVCTIMDSANGIVNISLPSSNTANIPSNRYVFDTKALSPANVTTRILEGMITVTPGVTR